ncbi:hypothetical protein PtA15_4A695 [Puccinia triticina]|uniref:Uncharacterized protein n=1 Tax=Puccinia triticina TaxID=208348 RepID=A0ABY7CJU9_9BASI|nr:uncharacterized protein PtA15_4A695 [Puccinia triticina]WAQ84242.1 hypothetical protein PtA15_4A695 [Puccinia triticina]
MPLIKGKMRKEEDSDSDESFHCCGRPEDLVEDWRSSMEIPKPDGNEVHVPDEQEYYLYSAGLDRLNSPDNGTKRGSCSSIHAIPRCSTVYSSDSDRTRIASPLLIIKTGDVVLPSPSPDMSFLRMAVSPTQDRPPSPELPTAQASAPHGPLPSASSLRRRGLVFTPSSLPQELKELAKTQDSDGSGT